MKIFILLGFVTFAFTDGKSMQHDCAFGGPTFWCKNAMTAERCHAVKYCKTYVWSEKSVTLPEADACSYCQNFVDTLHMMLENNQTQTELIFGMEMFCSLLPASTKDMCSSLVKLYGSQILADIVKSTEDAKALCTMIHLCSSQSQRVVLKNYAIMKKLIVEKVSGDYCQPCKEYISGLHSIISSKKTKIDLVNAMNKMCVFLPTGVSSLCHVIVEANGEHIVNYLIDYLNEPSRICAAVGLCKNQDKHVIFDRGLIGEIQKVKLESGYVRFSPEVKEETTATCTYCQQFVGTVHMLLMNNETQAEILSGMETFCQSLTSTMKTVCEDMVQIYGKQIVADIVEYTRDPRKLCMLIHLCSSESREAVLPNFLELKAVIEDKVFGDKCLPCKDYISGIHLMVLSMETKTELIGALRESCKFLPIAVSSWCYGMVDAKGSQMVDYFVDLTRNPSRFCAATKLCKNEDREQIIEPMREVVPEKPSTDVCTYCQEFVGTVRMMIMNNETTAQIIAGMNAACAALPSPASIICASAVELYGKTIIADVVKYTKDPRKICSLFHLCADNQNMHKETVKSDQVVWKHARKENNGLPCEICVQAIGTLDAMLKNNRTEEAIKEKLKVLCDKLPESIQGECVSLVSTYEDKIIKYLIKEFDPHRICVELGLCSSLAKLEQRPCKKSLKKVDHMLLGAFVPKCNNDGLYERKQCHEMYCWCVEPTNGNEIPDTRKRFEEVICDALPKFAISCPICIYAVKMAYISLADKPTQARIKATLLALCVLIPSKQVQGECTYVIDTYYDELINVIVKELQDPETLCKLANCVNSSKVFHVQNGFICDACVQGVSYVEMLLQCNKTKEIFEFAVDRYCHMTPFPKECKTLAMKYVDLILNTLLDQVKNPKETCKKIHLCPSSGEDSVSKMGIKDGPVCEVCEMGVTYIASYLNQNGTKAQIKNSLLQVCAELPSSFASECSTMVNQYFELAYLYILQELKNPAGLCKEIGMCSSSRKESVLKLAIKDGPVCEVCQMGVTYIASYLNQNGTKAQIKSSLLQACSELPSSFAPECTSMVNQYFDLAYAYVLQQLKNPAGICKEFGMCSSSVKGLTSIPIKDGPVCEVCEMGAQYLAAYLNKNETKAEIKSAVLNVCTILPPQFASQCSTVVNQYFVVAYGFLLQQLQNPLTLCQELKLCPASIKEIERKEIVRCKVCEALMKKMEKLINSSHKRKIVVGDLRHACDRLPKHLNKECYTLVDFYGSQLVRYLADEMKDPRHMCKDLGVCVMKSANGFVTCELCMLSMDYLLKDIAGKQTEEEIRSALENLCAKLPYGKVECKYVVDKYSKEIIDMVLAGVGDSRKVCKKLHYCSSSKKELSHGENPANCDLCKRVSTILELNLKEGSSKKAMKKIIKHICAKLNLAIEHKKECPKMLRKYKDTLIKLVKKGKVSSFCKKTGQCKSRQSFLDAVMIKPVSGSSNLKKPSAAACLVCKYAVGVLDTFLSGSAAQDKVIAEGLRFCKKLPRPIFVNECTALLKKYGVEVLKLFVDNVLAPVDLCNKVHLC